MPVRRKTRGERETPANDNHAFDPSGLLRVALVIFITVGALHYASEIFIPLAMSVIASLALSPIVTGLHRLYVPRWLGAALVLIAIAGVIGVLSYTLRDEVKGMLAQGPAVVDKLENILRLDNGFAGLLNGRRTQATVPTERGKAPARVEIVEPTVDWRDYLWLGTRNVAVAITQILVMFFLAFFLLSAGDKYKRKLTQIIARSEQDEEVTGQLFDEIQRQVERYLLVLLLRVFIVAGAAWAAFWYLGFENAAGWALGAGLLNIIPYIGPAVITALVALAALLQYETLFMALLVAGIVLAIMSLEEELLLPLLSGRAARMNAVAIFVGLLFWTWLWGVWGALLAVPLMMILKVTSDRVAGLRALSVLMSP